MTDSVDNTERDKYLTKKMGKCWHKQKLYTDAPIGCYVCRHCNETIKWLWENEHPDFSTWQIFGILWRFTIKEGIIVHIYENYNNHIFHHFINPNNFATAVYNYYMKREPDDIVS